ncbi:MAG: pitrilysin family protein [Planctomycetota bacterium]
MTTAIGRTLTLLLLLSAPAFGGPLMTRYDLDSGVGETVLDNGLTVLTLERHAAPVVSVQIWYRVGSADEPLGATGMAHFLEHLMFKGTDRYARGEIDRITLKLGGSNNAGTYKDWTQYYFNLASDRWETALEIEANRMTNLALDPREFEAERKVVLEELQMGRDSPWGELDETIESIAFSSHPYRHPVIGWRSDVERVARETVRAFYEKFYTPRNATLVIVGDFDTRAALGKVIRHFGAVPAGPELAPGKRFEPAQNGERRITVRRDTELDRLEIVYHSGRSGDADEAVRDVIEGLLVGNSWARLRRRLVEEDSAVTFVTAVNDARRDPGLFWIWTELRPGADRAAVESAIHEETARLASEEVGADELARAKKKILSDLVFRHATAERAAEDLGQMACEADWRDVGRAPDRIRAVTAADVRRVAEAIFAPANRTVGWALPRGDGPAGKKPPRRPRRARARGAPGGTGVAVRLAPTVVALPNGLTLLLARNTTVPVTAISAWVDGGRLREGKPGLAHLTGEYLAKGAGEKSARELADRLASLGADVTTRGTGLSARCLSEDADGVIPIVGDLLMRASFPEGELSKLRGRVLSQIRADRDDPEELVIREFHRAVFRGHPYMNPSRGTEESVAALTREDVVDHYRRHFVPGNTVIAVVSDRPTEEIESLLATTFGGWTGDNPLHRTLPAVAPTKPEVLRFERDIDQVQIALGHRGVRRRDPDWYALLVMDYVLGMGPGFTDRLSRTLRDRDGLAYDVQASIAGSADRERGRFLAYIATSAGQRDRAIRGIRREIDAIREELVTAEELADAKAYLTGSFVFSYETAEQLAGRLVDLHRLGLGFDYPARFAERIGAVTREDVLRVAKKHLQPTHLVTVIVGPTER